MINRYGSFWPSFIHPRPTIFVLTCSLVCQDCAQTVSPRRLIKQQLQRSAWSAEGCCSKTTKYWGKICLICCRSLWKWAPNGQHHCQQMGGKHWTWGLKAQNSSNHVLSFDLRVLMVRVMPPPIRLVAFTNQMKFYFRSTWKAFKNQMALEFTLIMINLLLQKT